MRIVPFSVYVFSIAFIIFAQEGEEKISPQTAHVNIPGDTKPACAGSCPLPPPHISFTVFKGS